MADSSSFNPIDSVGKLLRFEVSIVVCLNVIVIEIGSEAKVQEVSSLLL